MSETPELPPDEELPEVPEEKKEPFASTTDIVVILVVAVLAALGIVIAFTLMKPPVKQTA